MLLLAKCPFGAESCVFRSHPKLLCHLPGAGVAPSPRCPEHGRVAGGQVGGLLRLAPTLVSVASLLRALRAFAKWAVCVVSLP